MVVKKNLVSETNIRSIRYIIIVDISYFYDINVLFYVDER